MVRDTITTNTILIETKLMRRRADELLQRLEINRSTIEQRIGDSGRYDPMKFITGKSAMDNAISTTHMLITHMDKLLQEPADYSNGTGDNGTREIAKLFSVVVR